MYKIHYDIKAGVWRIQIQTFGIFWRSICDAGKVRGWPNVKACEEFILNTGLGEIYRNYRDSTAAHVMSGAQPYYPPPQVLRTNRA